MRILLIQPPKPSLAIGGEDVFMYEPLALEYLAAGVCDRHDVELLDLRIDDDFEHKLTTFNPDVVGITAYTVHVNVARQLFEKTKVWNPKILTVVGGHHATVKPEDFVSPVIDAIVVGEGVFPFRDIVEAHERGMSLIDIPGTFSPDPTNRPVWDCQTPVDLDALPLPARQYTARYRSEYYSEWMKPLASIRTSKGCPYRCNFCALWKIAGGKYWKREPSRVVAELETIEEEFVFFADDESLLDAPRMKRLAQLIRESGVRKRFFLYGRSDTIAHNPKLLQDWRAIGLERVFVGLESFQDRDLELYHKGSSTDQNAQAVRILHDLDIDVYASFIVHPQYDRADFKALKQYCRDLDLNYASFAVLTPLPGTDLYEEVKNQLIQRNYDCVDFIHTLLPTQLPLKDFYSEYHDLYKKTFSFAKQLSFLRKYPVREIPGLAAAGRRFYGRLRTAYKDYEA